MWLWDGCLNVEPRVVLWVLSSNDELYLFSFLAKSDVPFGMPFLHSFLLFQQRLKSENIHNLARLDPVFDPFSYKD